MWTIRKQMAVNYVIFMLIHVYHFSLGDVIGNPAYIVNRTVIMEPSLSCFKSSADKKMNNFGPGIMKSDQKFQLILGDTDVNIQIRQEKESKALSDVKQQEKEIDIQFKPTSTENGSDENSLQVMSGNKLDDVWGSRRLKKRRKRDIQEDIVSHRGMLRITEGMEWNDNLDQRDSSAYYELEQMMLNALEECLMDSPWGDWFYRVVVERFRKGSVIVEFTILFKNNTGINGSISEMNEMLQLALQNSSIFNNMTFDVNGTWILGGSSDNETTSPTANFSENTSLTDRIRTTDTDDVQESKQTETSTSQNSTTITQIFSTHTATLTTMENTTREDTSSEALTTKTTLHSSVTLTMTDTSVKGDSQDTSSFYTENPTISNSVVSSFTSTSPASTTAENLMGSGMSSSLPSTITIDNLSYTTLPSQDQENNTSTTSPSSASKEYNTPDVSLSLQSTEYVTTKGVTEVSTESYSDTTETSTNGSVNDPTTSESSDDEHTVTSKSTAFTATAELTVNISEEHSESTVAHLSTYEPTNGESSTDTFVLTEDTSDSLNSNTSTSKLIQTTKTNANTITDSATYVPSHGIDTTNSTNNREEINMSTTMQTNGFSTNEHEMENLLNTNVPSTSNSNQTGNASHQNKSDTTEHSSLTPTLSSMTSETTENDNKDTQTTSKGSLEFTAQSGTVEMTMTNIFTSEKSITYNNSKINTNLFSEQLNNKTTSAQFITTITPENITQESDLSPNNYDNSTSKVLGISEISTLKQEPTTSTTPTEISDNITLQATTDIYTKEQNSTYLVTSHNPSSSTPTVTETENHRETVRSNAYESTTSSITTVASTIFNTSTKESDTITTSVVESLNTSPESENTSDTLSVTDNPLLNENSREQVSLSTFLQFSHSTDKSIITDTLTTHITTSHNLAANSVKYSTQDTTILGMSDTTGDYSMLTDETYTSSPSSLKSGPVTISISQSSEITDSVTSAKTIASITSTVSSEYTTALATQEEDSFNSLSETPVSTNPISAQAEMTTVNEQLITTTFSEMNTSYTPPIISEEKTDEKSLTVSSLEHSTESWLNTSVTANWTQSPLEINGTNSASNFVETAANEKDSSTEPGTTNLLSLSTYDSARNITLVPNTSETIANLGLTTMLSDRGTATITSTNSVSNTENVTTSTVTDTESTTHDFTFLSQGVEIISTTRSEHSTELSSTAAMFDLDTDTLSTEYVSHTKHEMETTFASDYFGSDFSSSEGTTENGKSPTPKSSDITGTSSTVSERDSSTMSEATDSLGLSTLNEGNFTSVIFSGSSSVVSEAPDGTPETSSERTDTTKVSTESTSVPKQSDRIYSSSVTDANSTYTVGKSIYTTMSPTTTEISTTEVRDENTDILSSTRTERPSSVKSPTGETYTTYLTTLPEETRDGSDMSSTEELGTSSSRSTLGEDRVTSTFMSGTTIDVLTTATPQRTTELESRSVSLNMATGDITELSSEKNTVVTLSIDTMSTTDETESTTSELETEVGPNQTTFTSTDISSDVPDFGTVMVTTINESVNASTALTLTNQNTSITMTHTEISDETTIHALHIDKTTSTDNANSTKVVSETTSGNNYSSNTTGGPTEVVMVNTTLEMESTSRYSYTEMEASSTMMMIEDTSISPVTDDSSGEEPHIDGSTEPNTSSSSRAEDQYYTSQTTIKEMSTSESTQHTDETTREITIGDTELTTMSKTTNSEGVFSTLPSDSTEDTSTTYMGTSDSPEVSDTFAPSTGTKVTSFSQLDETATTTGLYSASKDGTNDPRDSSTSLETFSLSPTEQGTMVHSSSLPQTTETAASDTTILSDAVTSEEKKTAAQTLSNKQDSEGTTDSQNPNMGATDNTESYSSSTGDTTASTKLFTDESTTNEGTFNSASSLRDLGGTTATNTTTRTTDNTMSTINSTTQTNGNTEDVSNETSMKTKAMTSPSSVYNNELSSTSHNPALTTDVTSSVTSETYSATSVSSSKYTVPNTFSSLQGNEEQNTQTENSVVTFSTTLSSSKMQTDQSTSVSVDGRSTQDITTSVTEGDISSATSTLASEREGDTSSPMLDTASTTTSVIEGDLPSTTSTTTTITTEGYMSSPTSTTTLVTEGEMSSATSTTTSVTEGDMSSATSTTASVTEGDMSSATSTTTSVTEGEMSSATSTTTSVTEGDISSATFTTTSVTEGDMSSATSSTTSVTEGDMSSATSTTASVTEGDMSSATSTTASVTEGDMSSATSTTTSVTGGERSSPTSTSTSVTEEGMSSATSTTTSETEGGMSSAKSTTTSVTEGDMSSAKPTTTSVTEGDMSSPKSSTTSVTEGDMSSATSTTASVTEGDMSSATSTTASVTEGGMSSATSTTTSVTGGERSSPTSTSTSVTEEGMSSATSTTTSETEGGMSSAKSTTTSVTEGDMSSAKPTTTSVTEGDMSSPKSSTTSVTEGDMSSATFTSTSVTAGDLSSTTSTTASVTEGEMSSAKSTTASVTDGERPSPTSTSTLVTEEGMSSATSTTTSVTEADMSSAKSTTTSETEGGMSSPTSTTTSVTEGDMSSAKSTTASVTEGEMSGVSSATTSVTEKDLSSGTSSTISVTEEEMSSQTSTTTSVTEGDMSSATSTATSVTKDEMSSAKSTTILVTEGEMSTVMSTTTAENMSNATSAKTLITQGDMSSSTSATTSVTEEDMSSTTTSTTIVTDGEFSSAKSTTTLVTEGDMSRAKSTTTLVTEGDMSSVTSTSALVSESDMSSATSTTPLIVEGDMSSVTSTTALETEGAMSSSTSTTTSETDGDMSSATYTSTSETMGGKSSVTSRTTSGTEGDMSSAMSTSTVVTEGDMLSATSTTTLETEGDMSSVTSGTTSVTEGDMSSATITTASVLEGDMSSSAFSTTPVTEADMSSITSTSTLETEGDMSSTASTTSSVTEGDMSSATSTTTLVTEGHIPSASAITTSVTEGVMSSATSTAASVTEGEMSGVSSATTSVTKKDMSSATSTTTLVTEGHIPSASSITTSVTEGVMSSATSTAASVTEGEMSGVSSATTSVTKKDMSSATSTTTLVTEGHIPSASSITTSVTEGVMSSATSTAASVTEGEMSGVSSATTSVTKKDMSSATSTTTLVTEGSTSSAASTTSSVAEGDLSSSTSSTLVAEDDTSSATSTTSSVTEEDMSSETSISTSVTEGNVSIATFTSTSVTEGEMSSATSTSTLVIEGDMSSEASTSTSVTEGEISSARSSTTSETEEDMSSVTSTSTSVTEGEMSNATSTSTLVTEGDMSSVASTSTSVTEGEMSSARSSTTLVTQGDISSATSATTSATEGEMSRARSSTTLVTQGDISSATSATTSATEGEMSRARSSTTLVTQGDMSSATSATTSATEGDISSTTSTAASVTEGDMSIATSTTASGTGDMSSVTFTSTLINEGEMSSVTSASRSITEGNSVSSEINGITNEPSTSTTMGSNSSGNTEYHTSTQVSKPDTNDTLGSSSITNQSNLHSTTEITHETTSDETISTTLTNAPSTASTEVSQSNLATSFDNSGTSVSATDTAVTDKVTLLSTKSDSSDVSMTYTSSTDTTVDRSGTKQTEMSSIGQDQSVETTVSHLSAYESTLTTSQKVSETTDIDGQSVSTVSQQSERTETGTMGAQSSSSTERLTTNTVDTTLIETSSDVTLSMTNTSEFITESSTSYVSEISTSTGSQTSDPDTNAIENSYSSSSVTSSAEETTHSTELEETLVTDKTTNVSSTFVTTEDKINIATVNRSTTSSTNTVTSTHLTDHSTSSSTNTASDVNSLSSENSISTEENNKRSTITSSGSDTTAPSISTMNTNTTLSTSSDDNTETSTALDTASVSFTNMVVENVTDTTVNTNSSSENQTPFSTMNITYVTMELKHTSGVISEIPSTSFTTDQEVTTDDTKSTLSTDSSVTTNSPNTNGTVQTTNDDVSSSAKTSVTTSYDQTTDGTISSVMTSDTTAELTTTQEEVTGSISSSVSEFTTMAETSTQTIPQTSEVESSQITGMTSTSKSMVMTTTVSNNAGATENPTNGESNADDVTSTVKWTIATEQALDSPKAEYTGNIKLEEEFNPSLLDKNSELYKQKEAEMIAFLEKLLGLTILAGSVFEIDITGFRPGSVIVDFEVVFVNAWYDEQYLTSTLNTAYYSIFDPQHIMLDYFTKFSLKTGNESSDDTVGSTTSLPDPCDSSPCPSMSYCYTTDEGYRCQCMTGYVLDSDLCKDIDECVDDVCPLYSTCNNTEGSYSCKCDAGFTMENGLCNDVDECETDIPCSNLSQCINTNGHYFCKCNEGYRSVNDTCDDFDECQENLCQLHSTCENTPGSFKCECDEGFQYYDGLCKDVNECVTDPCPPGTNCLNTQGSFSCPCKSGYSMEGNGTYCSDIDECIMSGCPAFSNCTNAPGGYDCTCLHGFIDTGSTCIDKNECLEGPCPLRSICNNTEGSYNCVCDHGFVMQNGICEDINECGQDVCQDNSECMNYIGSYQCVCNTGYTMANQFCYDINECVDDLCPDHSICVNTEGSYTCICDLGYFQAGRHICIDAKVFAVSLDIMRAGDIMTYSDNLNDTNNEEFRDLSSLITNTTDKALNNTSVGYFGTTITKFTPGSSFAAYGYLYFNIAADITGDDVEATIRIRNETFTDNDIYLYDLNVSDINECNETAWNGCSEFSSCINTDGKYNCTCTSGYLDISNDAARPGRFCVAISDDNMDPISELRIGADQQYQLVNETVAFIVSLDRGSHVSYTISYGDGDSETKQDPEMLSFRSTVSFTHRFSSPGNYSVTVSGRNDISSDVTSIMICIIYKMKNITIRATEMDPNYTGIIRFAIESPQTDLTNVYLTWDFGDGFKSQNFVSEITDTVSSFKDHTFAVGHYIVKLNVSNEQSFQILTVNVSSEERITGLTAKFNTYITQPLKIIILNVLTITGSQLFINIQFGDGTHKNFSLQNNRRGSSDLYVPVVYKDIGKYNVSVIVNNSISSEIFVLDQFVYIQNPITDVSLKADPVIPLPTGKVILTLTYTGLTHPPNHVTCDVYIQNEFVLRDYFNVIHVSTPTIVITKWENLEYIGEAEINVQCFNNISNATFQTWTTFQRVIEGLSINADPLFVPINGIVAFNFTLSAGSHVQYKYNFSDGIFQNAYAETTSNFSIQLSHMFSKKGIYDVSFSAVNSVSQAKREVTIKVLEEVKGVSISRHYQVSDTTGLISFGHGRNNDVFPVERILMFEANVDNGNNLMYTWDFGDGSTLTSQDGTVTYQYTAAGSRIVKLNVSNALFHQMRSVHIILQHIVQPYSISNNGPKKAYETMVFDLRLTLPGTESCYIWDMGDGSIITIYGESNCVDKAVLNGYNYVPWEHTDSLQHSHMYKSNGTFYVKVTGFNTVSSQSISDIAVISGVSCFYPSVHIIGGGQHIDKPVSKLRSEWINLESTAEINCEVSDGPEYQWTIAKLSQGTTYLDHIYENYRVSAITTDYFKILFPPRTFLIGQYRISLNVSMKGIPGLFSEHYTFINVTSTTLVVNIDGGNVRVVGYDNMFNLNAQDVSYDPDEDEPAQKSNMTYEWSCKQENETFPSVLSLITIPDIDAVYNITRRGGCFGTGVGILPLDSGSIQLSSLLLDPHSTNIFRVTVSKGLKVGEFQQSVVVVDGEPPDIKISCIDNCKSKMNPSSPFSLTSQCLTCSPYDRITYRWNLYLQNEYTRKFETVSNISAYVVTDVQSSVIVFRSSVLIGGRVYRLRVDVKVYGYTATFTEYEFVTNLPPYGGSCNIKPTTGFALETKFIIHCNGWLNPGEENMLGAGLLYRFWLRPKGGLDTQLLYYGTDPYTPNSTFPLGPEDFDYYHDVVVRVANPIGEFVDNWIVVQVKEPLEDDNVNDLISLTSGEDNTLSELLTFGKTQQAKQMIVAVASLINTSPVVIGTSRASIIESQPGVATSTSGTVGITWTFGVNKTTSGDGTTQSNDFSTFDESRTTTLTVLTTMNAAERERQEQEDTEKRIQLRESLLETLSSETDSLTLDSVQQTAMCYRVVTHESSELSEKAQNLAVNAMSRLVDSFKKIVEQQPGEVTSNQKYSTAEDVLACLGSVVSAASEEMAKTLNDNQQPSDADGDEVLNDFNVTETDTRNTTSNNTGQSDSRTKLKAIAEKVLNLADEVYQTIVQDSVPGEPPVVLESTLMKLVVERKQMSGISDSTLGTTTGSFKMPSLTEVLDRNANSSYIDTQILSMETNPYLWADSAEFIKSPVITLNLFNSYGEMLEVHDLQEDIVIDINVDPNAIHTSYVNFPIISEESISYHSFEVQSNLTSIHMIIIPEDKESILECFVKFGQQPTPSDYDLNVTIPHSVDDNTTDSELLSELENTVFLPSKYIQLFGSGIYYIGVKLQDNDTDNSAYEDYDDYYDDYEGETTAIKYLNYTFTVRASGCFYWNEEREEWVSDGCRVSEASNSRFTRCLCNHLTSFGSDFFVPPNEINFLTVFSNMGAKLRDNWSVLAMICIVFFLYFFGVIWARYNDKKDIIKWGVSPLADNVLSDMHFYQITVCTGMRKGAGTKSKIRFVLAGELHDTGVRELSDDKGKTCSRGSVNNFVMGTQEWLGPLSFIRIWHDNSGPGKYQGWYLSRILITDLQTNDVFCFLCNRWLAVEEDDGMIDRLLPVAGTEDLTSFGNVFMTKTKKSFTDSHLWISVFSRPHRSTFTRVQRISCILSLVMTTMMANAMYYRTDDNVDSKESLSIGPLEITLQNIYISFVSSLIVLPVNLIVDVIFRKTEPKKNRITNAFMAKSGQRIATLSQVKLKTWDETKIFDITESDYLDSRPGSAKSIISNKSGNISVSSDALLIDTTEKRKDAIPKPKPVKKKKFSLPHPFIYVGWSLVFISSFVSAFITFLYSMEWGKEKSLSWLSSMLLSISESVVVIQPFKIIFLAMLLSFIVRKPDIEEETETDDVPSNQLKPSEELLHSQPTKALRPALKIDPPDTEKLALARETRLKEIKMHEILREIIFYLCFLTLIILVASHNRDTKAYYVKEALTNMMGGTKEFNKIQSIPGLWNWVMNVLLPRLYIKSKWNGLPIEEQERRMVVSMVAYRVGPVRIRQQRVKPEECKAIPKMYLFVETCSQEWSVMMEDSKSYEKGWTNLKHNKSVQHMRNYPWKHRSLFDDGSIPYVGEFGVYTGGGYVADLIGERDRTRGIAEDLVSKDWIDRYTRAVFVEFALYNPHVNMFSTVFVVFELPTTGDILVKSSVKAFRLFPYLGGYGIFVILCELVALASIVYFLVRECRKIRRQRKQYFKSFWNCLEMFNLITALASVIMYLLRHFLTKMAINTVTKLRDKFYNFQKIALWDEVFGYLMGFTVFIAILKLIHLFRFNRRMSMLSGTLRNSTKELSAFSVVFVIVILGFAGWGYVMFGPKMAAYRNMIQSIETLVAFSLGDFDYRALETVSRVFGPIYFFSFFLCVSFILLNVFVTILNESIATIKEDVSKQSNDHEIVSFIWERFKSWTGLDLDKLLRDVKRKYVYGTGDIDSVNFDDQVEDIERKLEDIAILLDKIDSNSDENTTLECKSTPPKNQPLFTRLFPTFKKQKLNLD